MEHSDNPFRVDSPFKKEEEAIDIEKEHAPMIEIQPEIQVPPRQVRKPRRNRGRMVIAVIIIIAIASAAFVYFDGKLPISLPKLPIQQPPQVPSTPKTPTNNASEPEPGIPHGRILT